MPSIGNCTFHDHSYAFSKPTLEMAKMIVSYIAIVGKMNKILCVVISDRNYYDIYLANKKLLTRMIFCNTQFSKIVSDVVI